MAIVQRDTSSSSGWTLTPSHTFAGIDAVSAGTLAQAEFPATSAGIARAGAWAARRTESPVGSLVVVEGIGSYGSTVSRAFSTAGYRVVAAHPQPAAARRGTGRPMRSIRSGSRVRF